MSAASYVCFGTLFVLRTFRHAHNDTYMSSNFIINYGNVMHTSRSHTYVAGTLCLHNSIADLPHEYMGNNSGYKPTYIHTYAQ